MELASIDAQICKCEMRIAECEDENLRLQNKINDLENAKNGYRQKQAVFAEQIWQECVRADRTRNASKIRLANSFANTMQALYTGNSYSRAENAFIEIGKKLDGGIQKFEHETWNNRRTIENARGEIASLRSRRLTLLQGV